VVVRGGKEGGGGRTRKVGKKGEWGGSGKSQTAGRNRSTKKDSVGVGRSP